MCTVTIIRAGRLLRVACNRDESRRRPHAHPPSITILRGRQVLAPQDPQGGGTWIAANSAGLIFTLLNAHEPRDARPAPGPSRGLVIPRVADCGSLEELTWRIGDLPVDTFAPCRLLAADERRVIDAGLGGGRCTVQAHPLDRPLLFTSSSLGDALVDGPRRVLFDQMVSTARNAAEQQDAFHAHRWRDRPALSVHMSRPDACTVSTTTVEATAHEVRMIYQPTHCAEGTPVGLIIDREQVEHDAPSRTRRQYAAV